MRELLLPVAEGVDTRRWLIERRIGMLEDQLRAWAVEPNPSLARAELVRKIEREVCDLYVALDAAVGVPRPAEIARTVEQLSEEEFLRYLDSFGDEQIVGWTGKLAWCPLALFIEAVTTTVGLRVRVYLDYVLIDDGYDEARVRLPPWAKRVTGLTTPPQHLAPEGTPIIAGELRQMLGFR